MKDDKDVYTGRAWTFGDGVQNDSGIMTLEMTRKGIFDPAELAKHCMAALNPAFPKHAKPGDVIVAGKLFGKGQLHIQGPLSIKGLGVGLMCVGMTRNFFRLSVSAGVRMLPFVPDLLASVEDADEIRVNFRTGLIHNMTQDIHIQADPLPDFLWEFIDAGGERAWLAEQAAQKKLS